MSHPEDGFDHTRLRHLLGPYLLGGLEPADRDEFEGHLERCAACTVELEGHLAVPGLLGVGSAGGGSTSSAEASAYPRDPATADGALSAAIGALRARRRRHRGAALSVAAALVVVLGTAAVLAQGPGSTTLPLTATDGAAVTGETSLSARPWGTSVELDLQGLPAGRRFVAWVVSPTGQRQRAATWGSTPDGAAVVTGAVALPADEVAEVLVGDSEGTVLLSTDAQ